MAYKINGKKGKNRKREGEEEKERENEEEFLCLFFHLSTLFSLLLFLSPLFSLLALFLFLSGCLLLLVVDRDGDDGRASADHPDGREAPLELAVAHLAVFFLFSGFFSFFSVSVFSARFFPDSSLLLLLLFNSFSSQFEIRTPWTSYMCLAWM